MAAVRPNRYDETNLSAINSITNASAVSLERWMFGYFEAKEHGEASGSHIYDNFVVKHNRRVL